MYAGTVTGDEGGGSGEAQHLESGYQGGRMEMSSTISTISSSLASHMSQDGERGDRVSDEDQDQHTLK